MNQEPEEGIYWQDLFRINGRVTWSEYKVILLLALGMALVIPLAVPASLFLLSIETHLEDTEMDLIQLSPLLTWLALGILIYVFLNLTQKANRTEIEIRKE